MSYKLPDKSLLEESSDYIKEGKKYFSLSKMIFKKDMDQKLLFPVGLNSEDKYYVDLENKSSMLILGETGSGKSNFINSIIISLLLKNTPDELNFIFIDPRKVELAPYEDIPHTKKKIISNSKVAVEELNNLVNELSSRSDLFLEKDVKTIGGYNKIADEKLPQILIIIDEASEMMDDVDFKDLLLKILNDGARFGIHIIMSTSSYLDGKLSRFFIRSFNYVITFDLANYDQADYIKISEANLLTIYGEALIKCSSDKIIDLQTPYVSENDINKVINFIKRQSK